MTELTAQTGAALNRIIADRQSKHRVPGIAAAVARSGGLVWSGATGAADLGTGEPPGPDTQFLVASISKTFTAVLIMGLRDAGRLSLDDPLETYVPESKHAGITIRQLLSHVSGMQREPVGDVWEQLTFPSLDELLAGWNEAERIGRPHDLWHYSNLAYSILGEVVARVDGRPWTQALQARILDPLGMRRTTLGLAGTAATGYYVPPFSDVPVTEPVLDIGAMAACGGLASTTTDLAAWTMFLAEGNDEVLAKATLDEMCQVQTIADPDRWSLGWGLGLMLVRIGDRVYAGHTGGMPGHITGMFVHRRSGTAGIALMNSTSAPDPAALATDLIAEVLDNDPEPAEPWTAGTVVPDEFAGLLGTWFSEGQAFVFSVRKGLLEARQEKAPEHKESSVFERIDDDVYRTKGGREPGEILRVTRDERGVPVKLNWATYLFTREPYAFGEWLRPS
jgi:CubicO group peptidase (beta-lactamase class C family)